jgi:hypothetical protein
MAQDLTDEEYDALDEKLTRTTPKLSGKPGGYFTERRARLDREGRTVVLDQCSADYIRSAVESTHKTPTEIIGELVREKIAASA